MCPAQVNAQWGVGTRVWQRSQDRAGQAPGDLGTGRASATQGCTSVLTAAQPRQASSQELVQDPRWPLISGSGCLGPGVLTRSTGGGWAHLDQAMAGSPRRKVSQDRAGGARRVVSEDPDCGQGPSLKDKGASAEGSSQWDPPGNQSRASRRWARAGEDRTEEDGQTDRPA